MASRATNNLTRRAFGIGLTAGLSLPVASWLASRSSRAEGQRPQRFLVYFVPHGWPIEQVEPLGAGANWLDANNRILGGFAPWRDRVTVIRGVGMPPGTAHAGVHHVLTGTGTGADSIEHTVADSLGVRPWHLGVAMRHGNDDYAYHSRVAHYQGAPIFSTVNPLEFVDALFEGTEDVSAHELEVGFRSQLYDLSERQLERLQAELGGLSRERDRVVAHIEAVREAKARNELALPDAGACGVDDLRMRLMHLDGVNGHDIMNTAPILEGHFDAMASMMICGAVTVGLVHVHGSGGEYRADFPGGPGVAGNPHMNSHAGGPAQRRIDEYGATLRWYLDRLQVLVERLDVPDPLDPDHTVLDNTTILYTSEMCDGSHVSDVREIEVAGGTHTTYHPMVLIGGCAGRVNTGGVIDVSAGHVDVLQTLASMHGGATAHGNVLDQLLV